MIIAALTGITLFAPGVNVTRKLILVSGSVVIALVGCPFSSV